MAVALALLAGAAVGLQMPFLAATPRGVCPRTQLMRASSTRMVAAKDVFGQFYEASTPVQKSMRTLPPPVAKGAMAGLVAVAGAAGFVLTPSRKLVVNGIGGVLTASLGNVARKRLADERQKAVMPAVAALLAEGLNGVTPETLSAIASEYDVPKKEFQSQMADLFLAFLNACLNSHQVETSELSELLRLKDLLRLSAAQVGAQIHSAAKQLYSRHRAYLEDTEPNDSKLLLEKFVFLAERMLSEDESPEGYKYESLRLQKIFGVTANDWRNYAEQAAVPFYEKALNSAVLEGQPVTAQQLESMRRSLGITNGCAEGMHAEIFAQAVSGMLESGAFAESDQERLAVLEELLGMSADTSAANVRALTAPLYTTTMQEVIQELTTLDAIAVDGASTTLASKLDSRQRELLLSSSDAQDIEAAALRTKAAEMLDEASALVKAQNMVQGLASIRAVLSFCDCAASFCTGSGRATGDALTSLFAGVRGTSKQSEVLSLYRVLLLHFLEDNKVDEAEALTLARMRTIIGLSDSESDSVYEAAAAPLLRKVISNAVGGELGATQKAELQATVADLGLPASVATAVSVDVYSARLRALSDGKIMGEDEAESLVALRDFLALSESDVYRLHEEVCSSQYKTSVREVMGTSGIIPDEYWEGLELLRNRLCLSEEAAQKLFATEVTAKMKTFGTKAVEALEEKARAQQKKADGEESGGQLSMADPLTAELLNLVEFATASKTFVTKEVDGELVETAGANLRDQFELRSLKELYRQYLVEAFSGAKPEHNQKLLTNMGKVSLLLGLSGAEVRLVNNEIGSLIYRQFISKALPKGPLTEQDRNFLATIKDALGMEQSKCDELVRDQELTRVSVLVEQMFEKAQVLAEDVRTMRDAVDMFDVDLVEDLQVSTFKLERLFIAELEDLITTGALKANDMGAIEELCETLHISEERASSMLQDAVQKRASGGLLQAACLVRQNAHDSASKEIEDVLRFAGLLDDVKAEAPSVSQRERNELLMLYQASLQTAGVNEDESKEQIDLLKGVMGLQISSAA